MQHVYRSHETCGRAEWLDVVCPAVRDRWWTGYRCCVFDVSVASEQLLLVGGLRRP